MLNINYFVSPGAEGTEIHRLSVSGHANYDKNGKDIVCSAASILCIGLAETLIQIDGGDYDMDLSSSETDITFIAEEGDPWVKGVFAVTVAGFEYLAGEYPDFVILE